jgi:FtsZ-binding cell division protein ZapB
MMDLKGMSIIFAPVISLLSETNTKLRRSKKQWQMKLRPLLKTLASYENVLGS